MNYWILFHLVVRSNVLGLDKNNSILSNTGSAFWNMEIVLLTSVALINA